MSHGTYAVVESQLKSLPDHWESEGVTTDQRRVMETFDVAADAKNYIEENYGMYADDAEVIRTSRLEVMWKDE